MNYLFALVMIHSVKSACCLQCNTVDPTVTDCLFCNSGYYLLSGICLYYCPSVHTSITGGCLPYASTLLISTNFNELLSFNPGSDFSPAGGVDYNDLNSLHPTLDQGFYCTDYKGLFSNSQFSFSPELTLNFYISPSAEGIVSSLHNVAAILYTAQELCIFLNVLSQVDYTSQTINVCAGPFNAEWARVCFKITQVYGDLIGIQILKNDQSLIYSTFSNFEARGSDGVPGLIYVGDEYLLSSFTGFIYTLSVYNSYSDSTLTAKTIPNCNFLQFYVYGQCSDCNPFCTNSKCRFGDSCNTCYFTNCQTCTGYSTNDCILCDNGETAPDCCEYFCETCTTFYFCTACQPEKVLVDNVCLYGTPFGITGTSLPIESVLSLIFDNQDFGSYPGWNIGSDSSTYYHNGNGETDDPIPYKNRGLYFNGVSTYLEYDSNILLAHKNTIRFLIKPINIHPCQTLLKLDSALKILNCGQVELTTEYSAGVPNLNAVSYSATKSGWHFLTVRISTVNFDTTVTVYQDSSIVASSTINLSAFRMASSSVILGTGDGLYFYGFLYSIEIFQTDQNTIAGYYSFCVNEVDSGCVHPCGINQYLANNICYSCLGSCSVGCKDSQDCNFCVDSYCSECSSLKSLSCTLCLSSFSLLGGVCYCPGSYVAKNNNCEICYNTCSSCSDIYINSCTSCTTASNYLLENICVETCPTGYNTVSQNCYFVTSLIVNMKFNLDSSYSNEFGFDSGSDFSGFDENDPYPTLTRGFYFRSKSHMTKTLTMPPHFTVNIWIKVEADGVIINNSVLKFQALTGEAYFILVTQNFINYEAVCLIQYNTWMYLSYELDISSTAQSTYSFYLDSVLIFYGSTSENSLMPLRPEYLIIGDRSQSFQGFIWMLKVYVESNSHASDFSTTGCSTSCSNCDSDFTCPTDCSWMASINDCSNNCPEACIYCYDSTFCDSCYPLAYRYGLECKCYSNVWNTVLNECECRDCYITCETCNSCNFQGCETCKSGFYLIATACIYCPTGYIESESTCTMSQNFVFDFKFDKILGVVYDSQSNFAAITGTSQQFYPNYEYDDPVAAYGRGYYFNGVSSIVRLPPNDIDSRTVVIGAEFTFEIWFRSIGNTGTLYCKQELSSLKSRYCLAVSPGSLLAYIYISDGHYEEGALIYEGTDYSIWNYLSIGSYLSDYNNFELGVQYNKNILKSYTTDLLIDSSSGTTTVGAKIQSMSRQRRTSEAEFTDYFNGFIYRIRLYNIGVSHPISSNSICAGGCLACDVETGSCFSDCGIESVVPSCETCGDCTNGCFDDSSNCELSGDGLCETASDYGVCGECKDNAEFIDGVCNCVESSVQAGFECVTCEEGYYLDQSSCVKCEEKCKNCNSTECLECNSGFYLNNSDCEKCVSGCLVCTETDCSQCDSGFFLNDTNCEGCKENCILCNSTDCLVCDEYSDLIEGECMCKQENKGVYCSLNTLLLQIYVNQDNSLVFMFSNAVSLSKNDLNIYVSNKSQEFNLNELNASTYLVIIEFVKDVKEGNELKINFKVSFVLKNQFTLEYVQISVNLYSKNVEVIKTIEKFYESVYSTTAVYACVAATSFTSINPSPASLWNFLSSVQLLTYLYMLKIPYSNRTIGLLKGLRKYNMFPNLFEFIVETNGSDHEYTKAKDIGFTTNSILKNIGNIFSMLICFLVLYYILRLLAMLFAFKKTEKIKKFLEEMCSDYKYGFFIRFWIQSYIEILAGTFVAIKPVNLSNLEDAYNFLAACFLMVNFT